MIGPRAALSSRSVAGSYSTSSGCGPAVRRCPRRAMSRTWRGACRPVSMARLAPCRPAVSRPYGRLPSRPSRALGSSIGSSAAGIQGGAFRLTSGTTGWSANTGPERGSLTLEGANLGFALLDNWPVLEAPRALVRLDDNSFELAVPDATFAVPDGRKLLVKGTFTIDMSEPLPRTGKVAVRGQGPLSLALELLDVGPLQVFQGNGISLASVEGKVDSQITVSMPLGQPLEPRDVAVEGKARISEGRLGQMFAPYEVHGANVAIDMTA